MPGAGILEDMTLVVVLLLLAVILGAVGLASKASKNRALEKKAAELEPVKKLAFEDITALGVALQELDFELSGHQLDEGQNADYQRALDAYEAAKTAGDSITEPDHIRHVTEIIEDGRYAIACVRARVAGEPLPSRRPPCFFDPRHGLSVADVPWTPPGGATRDVPACALDAERVRAGRRARLPDGHGRLPAGALLPGRRGLPALRPRLLRRLHADGLDVRRPALQRLRWLRHARRDRRRHRRRRSAASATASATCSTGSTSSPTWPTPGAAPLADAVIAPF